MSSSEVATCPLCGGRPLAEVASRWTFLVERVAPSQNKIASNTTGRGNWAYRKERDAWTRELSYYRIENGIPIAAIKRRVTITRCYAGRQQERDYGNLVGGLKAAVDAMVLVGLLKDDSPKWSEIFYHQRRVEKGEHGTLFTIEELA